MVTKYWSKRLVGKTYEGCILKWGYPKKGDTKFIIEHPWRGFVRKTITHPHFGPDPVEVFAIDVTTAASDVEASQPAQQNAAYEDEQAKPGDAHHLDPNGLRPAHIAATAAKTREGFPTPPVQLPEATMADKLVDWPCTTVEQDEDCAVGYPSLFCGACEGTGRAPEATVIALAPEMLRIASEIGEPEDPFAAWESIDLIKSQNDQLRRVLNKTGDWINSLPVPTSCATRMFGLVSAAANEVIGGMNDQGSNREILEKVCLNDPDNAPKNENIATSAAKGCAE